MNLGGEVQLSDQLHGQAEGFHGLLWRPTPPREPVLICGCSNQASLEAGKV